MAVNTAQFNYLLPPDRIAQTPALPRDHSRLLSVDRKTGDMQHRRFFELGDLLQSNDLLVINESRVFKARLRAQGVEILLVRSDGPHWIALAKPGRKLRVDSTVTFEDGTACRIVEKREDGTVRLAFEKSAEEVLAWTDRIGEVPLPPYLTRDSNASFFLDQYQTIYAKTIGSVAAPTAGFHFTPELIEALKARDIRFATITLHVGIGTFRPIKTETIEEHQMHEEWIDVPDVTIAAIEETKKRGGRVIAVGTTTVRALESEVRHGWTTLFITPGFQFKRVDGLITNFHLPKSTLLVLVSAFAGRELVQKAYAEAIAKGYRFYSFGDALFIA